jgi:flagellar biosynthesis GTPase FlhF
MAKDLTNEEDVEQSVADAEGGRQSDNIKIPEGKTPVYILKSDYADGYVHWVNLPEGPSRVVCGCAEDHKGWDPENCPLCKITAQLYGKAKKLENEEGKDTPAVKKVRAQANRIRSKYEAHFLAVAGELVKEKVGPGKFVWSSDFENARVGILSMTRQQFNDFTALRNSPDKFPFMKGPSDLCNRAIVLEKSKKGNSDFATTDFIPSKRSSDPPEVEYEEDDFDLDSDFEVDAERLEKIAELLADVEGDTDDAGVEMEDEDEKPKKKKVITKTSSKVKSKKSKASDDDDDLLGEEEESEEEEEEPEAEEESEEEETEEESTDEEEAEEESEEETEEEEKTSKKTSKKVPPKKIQHGKKVHRK